MFLSFSEAQIAFALRAHAILILSEKLTRASILDSFWKIEFQFQENQNTIYIVWFFSFFLLENKYPRKRY